MFTRRGSLKLFGGSALGLAAPGAALADTVPAAFTDPLFNQPYIDVDEWRDAPVRHRYMHGGFKGTEARFSFYFPPADRYERRFFQHLTPVPLSENLAQSETGANDKISLAASSGAYYVETNQGGAGATGMPAMAVDPSIAGYRVSAAAAEFSRVTAAKVYGPHRPFGYAYGGSGGAFRTIGGFENTTAWDGAVPYVIGSPMAIPNVFTVRLHALRILKDRFPGIVDAADAGGVDIYAGLNAEERAALVEVTKMGFPPRTWYAYQTLGMGPLAVLIDGVGKADPTYFQDFWTVPGYLGANPPESLAKARVQHKTTIAKLILPDEAARIGLPPPPSLSAAGGVSTAWKTLQAQSPNATVAIRLASAPAGDLEGAKILVQSGAAAGQALPLDKVHGDVVMFGMGAPSEVVAALKSGDAVQLDNSDHLAIQTYHRHQVPGRDYSVWDQFRGPDGKPLYPQRPKILGPIFAYFAAGAVQTGRFKGKMIVVESLMDEDAFPWQADWYRTKVREALGDRLDDNFRLWFTDHALHTDVEDTDAATRTVSYLGVLHQALRDLSAWVEKGVAPPASTRYQMADGQVQVPATAAERCGVQPVVTVLANGAARAEAQVGQPVVLTAVVETPPNTGVVVGADWDFEGEGRFATPAPLPAGPAARVSLTTTRAFSKPGTYFPVLRAASQRQGDVKTPFGRIQNLGRVRVVVT